MENFNFVALTVELLFAFIYLMAFLAYDKVSRLASSTHRKTDGIIFATAIFIFLLVLGILLPDYMSYIVSGAVVLFLSSLRITFAKEGKY